MQFLLSTQCYIMKAARFGLEVFVGSGAQPLPDTGTMSLDRLCLDDSHCDFCDSRVASIITVEAIDNEDRLGSRDYNHDPCNRYRNAAGTPHPVSESYRRKQQHHASLIRRHSQRLVAVSTQDTTSADYPRNGPRSDRRDWLYTMSTQIRSDLIELEKTADGDNSSG